MAFLPAVKQYAKKVNKFFTLKVPAGSKIAHGTLPLGPAGGAMALKGVSKIGQSAKTLFQRATGNPFANSSAKALAGRIAGRAVGYGLALESFRIARGAAAGDKFNIVPSFKDIAHIGAIAINPIAGVAGTIVGTGQKAGKTVLDEIKDAVTKTPIPVIPDYKFAPVYTTPDVNLTYADPVGVAPTLSVPTTSVGFPGVSFSVERGPDIGMALLALLAGGAGGYAIARRRKKRKKYKGRKRRK